VDELEGIVQRMIEAGESEEAIAAVIQGFPAFAEGEAKAAAPKNPDMIPIEQRTLQQAADAAPDMLREWATQVGPLVAGSGLMKGASKVAPWALSVLDNPIGGATVGTIVGGLTGGPVGALTGGVAGYTGGGRVVGGLRRALGKSNSQRMTRGMSQAAKAPAPAPAVPQATPQQALQKEIQARNIDWRTTDAVPIDAIKRDMSRGGSIIEAGESQVGLAEQLAKILKSRTPEALAEADRLARAIRQRGHITAKSH
jgi:hypothetical protein